VPLLGAALLFWQQITRMGPRRYTTASPFARFAMLVGVEVPNIIAGITIAFRSTPLYSFYAAQETEAIARGAAMSQQTVSGALVWVFGSLVYIVSIVLVVNEIFRREGVNRAEPPAGWDSDERFIAPGLEGRLKEVTHAPHDWREY
jgi:cytochrome c oxidase assembly factor CtaG